MRIKLSNLLNIWYGIVGDHIVRPLFIHGNLTGEIYLNMLEPFTTEKIEDHQNNNVDKLLFQQEGASLYYVVAVRK